MKTFWQLLRIAFWMLPLQRALTVVGAAVLIGGQIFDLPLNMPGSTLPVTFLGVALMMIVPLFAGGVFLRMLASSRALLLRPRARGRLLAGTFSILLTVTAVWIFCYWVAFLPAPAKYKPDLEAYLLMFTTTVNFGTLCTIFLFIASRSPLWTLVMLFLWQAPALVLRAFGVDDASRLIGGPVSVAASAVAWVAFAFWFLRARHIAAGVWRRNASTSSARTEGFAAPATREQAMTRWVFANGTPLRFGLQCLLAGTGVVALQWALGREAGTRPLQAMMFGALSAVTVVTGAISSSMAARSRTLWLAAGRTRLQLHGWMELRMLLVAAAVLCAIALAAALAWFLVSPHPALPPAYVFAALLTPGLCAGWLGLMQQHRRGLFDVIAGLAIFAGIFYGLVRPLYLGSTEARWDMLGGQLALALLLREVAWARWRSADWRRA